MYRHFILTARIYAVTLLAISVLSFMPTARAQDQTQVDDLRKDVSYLNSRVCGIKEPTDSGTKKVYDDQKQALTDAATALIEALDQQKSKLTGSDFDTTLAKQKIDDEEKSLRQSCPALPDDLQKIVNAASPATAPVAVPSATPVPQVPVAPTTVRFDNDQTIGTRSAPTLVTVTNNTTGDLDLFIWYGTHLANFWVSDDTCNGITPPQGKCTFNVAFAPTEMLTAGKRELVENLRVVSRDDWKKYDKIRSGYKQVSDAEAAVDEATKKIIDQRKNLSDTAEAVRFCRHLHGDDKLLADCKNLKDAEAKFEKLRQYNKFTEQDVENAANELRDKTMALIPLSGTPDHWKYPLTRAVVGLDASAVSSQTVRRAYFVDFNLLAPFRFPWFKTNEDALESRWWFWLNPRITSLPKAADPSAISTIDEAGTFFTNFSNQGHTADIAQGFDVNGGLEMALIKPRDGIPWWGEYVNTQARLGISMIGGAGMATPFSIPDTDVTSQVNQSICDAFKVQSPTTVPGPTPGTTTPVSDGKGLVCTIPSGATTPQVVVANPAFDPNNPTSAPATLNDQFISFITPERSRFFRRYYAGFRLKTYFFSPDVKGECKPERKGCDAPYDIFPGIIDVTAGQDEAVTKGKLTRVILRIEGVYPLPFVPGFHVFGSIYTSFKKNTSDPPFNTFTVNAPLNGTANDANTFRFPLAPLDRDYFRVGVGVDLIQLLKRNKGGQPTTNTSTSPSQSGSSTATSSGSSGNSTK